MARHEIVNSNTSPFVTWSSWSLSLTMIAVISWLIIWTCCHKGIGFLLVAVAFHPMSSVSGFVTILSSY